MRYCRSMQRERRRSSIRPGTFLVAAGGVLILLTLLATLGAGATGLPQDSTLTAAGLVLGVLLVVWGYVKMRRGRR